MATLWTQDSKPRPHRAPDYACTDPDEVSRAIHMGSGTMRHFLTAAMKTNEATKVLMMGDSLTVQRFNALSCLAVSEYFPEIKAENFSLFPTRCDDERVPQHWPGQNLTIYLHGREQPLIFMLYGNSEWSPFRMCPSLVGQLGPKDVLAINYGLHYFITDDVALRNDTAHSRYAANVRQMVNMLAPMQFKKVWIGTTAVHSAKLPPGVDRAKFHPEIDAKSNTVNAVAWSILRTAPDWSYVDSYQATGTREDGLFPGDVRHYASEVVEAMLGEFLFAVAKLVF